MNFNLSTAGVTTKKGSVSRGGDPEFDQAVFIVDPQPGEGSKSWKFRMNKPALELINFSPDSNEDQYFTFIDGDQQSDEELKGRLFIGRFGEEIKLNKAWENGYADDEQGSQYARDFKATASKKAAHEFIVDKFDWINAEERTVLSVEYVPNEQGIDILELKPFEQATEEPEDTQEERPDVDTAAQEMEEANSLDW